MIVLCHAQKIYCYSLQELIDGVLEFEQRRKI